MPHLPVVAAAGTPEATRTAQSLIHRGTETAMVVVSGERTDRIHAERLPEAGAGERIGHRDRERRRGRDGRKRRGDGAAAPDAHDAPPGTGGLIDLQA